MTVDIATLAIRVESLEAQNATRELNRLREAGGSAEQSTNGLTASARKLRDMLAMVAAATAAIKMYEAIKEATLLASRYNELGIVMGVLGRNAGFSARVIAETEASLRKTGISAIQSRDAIAKLVSANIDLSKATDLARLAQDAAVIGGMNSSEAFARLIKGIQSAEKETLETMGLNVNFQKSYDDLAKTLGKTAKDLTTVEKTQAGVNAVMAKAPAIAGTYEASLTNSGKQMRSMARYIEDLKVQLGQPFQNPFGELIDGSTKALKFALDNADAIRSAIERLVAAIVPAMKIAAAYFAIFVAAPAILTAVAAAFTPLIHALALYAMNVAIGQTQTLYFNRTLFGMSVSAQLAAGTLTKLGLAIKALFALFVGWEIGTYLNDQFLEVRVAGEVMAGALLEGWENIRYGAVMAWEAIKYSFTGIIGGMKVAFANFLNDTGRGLRMLGATETGSQIVAYAEGLRKAGEAQKSFGDTTKGVTAEHEKNLKIIETVTQSRIDKEVIAAKVVGATSAAEAAAVKPKKALVELTEAQKKAYESAMKSAKDYIESLKIEISQIGLNDGQIRMMTAAREAAKAPEKAQRLRIMELALAREIAIEADEEKLKTEKLIIERAEAMIKIQAEYADQLGEAVDSANKEALANAELVRTFGMAKSAIEQLEIARMYERIERLRGIEMTDDEITKLELLIATKKRSSAALVTLEGLESQKNIWKSIEETAHDTFISIFDSGKNAFDRLRDTLKNGLLDLLYQMTIKKWIFQIAASVTGSGVAGAASAQAGSAVGSAGSSMLGSALGGASLFGAGGLAGSMAAGAGWLTGATTLGGSLTAAGSLAATGTLGGIASSLGMVVGALGPIALGIGAAVAIWKSFDTSGTYHTGGASSASSAGAHTIRAESLHFEATRTNAETEKMTATLASGIVNILDSTALAFGKTAGYTAATAFADDTSRDGAWGGLVIDKLGAKVLDWQDTRGNGPWAPKLFADGAAGQEQYLAAVSKSVRTALDGIGLPAWAKTMLDGVGAGASIDELAKVVDNINVTQRALVIMGNSLTGFSQLGDKATSALIAASGGIEGLASNASAYYDAFYSEGEKSAGTIKQIKDALAAVNIAMPATQAAYRAQVEAQMKLGEAGAPAVAVLLKVAGAFAQVTPQMEAAADAARSAADVLSERMDLQKQLDELTMSSTQLLTKQRMALDASNRGLFDQIQAAQKAKDAQDAARSSLDDFLGQMKSFADTTKGLNGSLLTGSMSTLTPEQQYAETSRQLDQTLAAIRAGDTSAQGNLKSVEDAFLAASMKSNSGDSLYASDFARVLQVNDEISQWASGQIDTAQASLDALNAQVIGINDLNAAMLGVADAINGLPAAFGATPPAVSMPAPVLNYSTMGTANTEALVAEVKALRSSNEALVAEVKGLRADQQQQTGDLLDGNYDASRRAAQTVVDATIEEAEKTRWDGRRKVAIDW